MNKKPEEEFVHDLVNQLYIAQLKLEMYIKKNPEAPNKKDLDVVLEKISKAMNLTTAEKERLQGLISNQDSAA